MIDSSEYFLSVRNQEIIDDWEQLRLSVEGSFYLSAAFASILLAEGYTPLYIRLLNQKQDCCGIALAFLSDQWRRWPLNLIFRKLVLHTHPVVKNKDIEFLEVFCRQVVQFANNLGVAGIYIYSEDAVISPHGLSDLGMVSQERIEFLLNIRANDDEYLARMSSRRRGYLRKMTKEGHLSIREQNDEVGVNKLIEFQGSSRDRRRKRGEDYAISSQSAATFLARHYLHPGYARLFIADMEGVPAAAVMLHCDNGRAYYTMAGSSAEGFQFNAPTFLVWEVMRALRKDGFQTLNLGGVPEDAKDKDHIAHGLYQFKHSFGGEEIRCISWQKQDTGLRSKLSNILDIIGN